VTFQLAVSIDATALDPGSDTNNLVWSDSKAQSSPGLASRINSSSRVSPYPKRGSTTVIVASSFNAIT
jgi:hypothetical protein